MEATEVEYDLIEQQFLSFLTKGLIPYVTRAEFKPSRKKKFYIKITYRTPHVSGFSESPKMDNKDARELYSKVLKRLGWN